VFFSSHEVYRAVEKLNQGSSSRNLKNGKEILENKWMKPRSELYRRLEEKDVFI
jgi:hypothetical protein